MQNQITQLINQIINQKNLPPRLMGSGQILINALKNINKDK